MERTVSGMNDEKSPSLRILIVDDEPNIRKTLRIALESMSHQVSEAGNAADALQLANRSPMDVAFLDIRLGQESGLDLLSSLLESRPGLLAITITAYASIDAAVDAMRRGAFDFLAKPFNPGQIRGVLERAIKARSLKNRVTELEVRIRTELPAATTEERDSGMRAIFAQAAKVAATDAAVLIRGENGTGKGVLARAIHGMSRRATMPFLTVNCPSLNGELLESDLFGHARGAFTGAVRDSSGKVAAAEGGTLFLDEIGDLPLTLQPKLLRFLQDHHYERVGESITRSADIRLIAATNRDIEAAVSVGDFREDLLYRLNVVEFTLPPLRQRTDIIPLAEELLVFFAGQIGRSLEGFDEGARNALTLYPWPGNIRELRNAVERATIFAAGPKVGISDLPERVANVRAGQGGDSHSAIEVGRPVSLEAIEAEHIRRILTTTSTREDAARILGIDPSTLYRKRKHLGL